MFYIDRGRTQNRIRSVIELYCGTWYADVVFGQGYNTFSHGGNLFVENSYLAEFSWIKKDAPHFNFQKCDLWDKNFFDKQQSLYEPYLEIMELNILEKLPLCKVFSALKANSMLPIEELMQITKATLCESRKQFSILDYVNTHEFITTLTYNVIELINLKPIIKEPIKTEVQKDLFNDYKCSWCGGHGRYCSCLSEPSSELF